MPIRITVKRGICQGNIHKTGQVITVGNTTPEGVCLGAWNAIAPYITALLYGGTFPWEKEGINTTIHCPDPKGIVFELTRVEGEDKKGKKIQPC